jgi:hypothetical protein
MMVAFAVYEDGKFRGEDKIFTNRAQKYGVSRTPEGSARARAGTFTCFSLLACWCTPWPWDKVFKAIDHLLGSDPATVGETIFRNTNGWTMDKESEQGVASMISL